MSEHHPPADLLMPGNHVRSDLWAFCIDPSVALVLKEKSAQKHATHQGNHSLKMQSLTFKESRQTLGSSVQV